MRIRLALTLDVRREPQPADDVEQHDTTLDALVIDAADQPHDAPRIGFRAVTEDA